ncbi:MAG: hypothetical protein D6732_20300 [Methanobacteriota archaeon]|nr:MAG: hypothetical protein D6732_20300 [Euryarchaeota archaeon]
MCGSVKRSFPEGMPMARPANAGLRMTNATAVILRERKRPKNLFSGTEILLPRALPWRLRSG